MERKYQTWFFPTTTTYAWKTNLQQTDTFCSCHSSLSISSLAYHLMIGNDNQLF